MTEQTTSDTHGRRQQIRSAATRLVRHVRRDVLPSAGTRASVRAAVGSEPGDPRTFAAIKEVARFLPGHASASEERAFLAVAALLCAQPARGRKQDAATGPPDDVSTDQHVDTEDGSATAKTDEDDPAVADDGSSSDETSDSPISLKKPRSLGESCAQAVLTGVANGNTMEGRLHALCRANSAGVHRQLPSLISYLRGGGVGVNWVVLIEDLAAWDRFRKQIATRWLRDYHRPVTAAQAKTTEKNEENE